MDKGLVGPTKLLHPINNGGGGVGLSVKQRAKLLDSLALGQQGYGHVQRYYLIEKWNELADDEKVKLVQGMIMGSAGGYEHNIVYFLLEVDGISAYPHIVDLCIEGLSKAKGYQHNITEILDKYDGLTLAQKKRLGKIMLDSDLKLNGSHVGSIIEILIDLRIPLEDSEVELLVSYFTDKSKRTALIEEIMRLSIHNVINKRQQDRLLSIWAESAL